MDYHEAELGLMLRCARWLQARDVARSKRKSSTKLIPRTGALREAEDKLEECVAALLNGPPDRADLPPAPAAPREPGEPYPIPALREDRSGITYITFESDGQFHTVGLLPTAELTLRSDMVYVASGETAEAARKACGRAVVADPRMERVPGPAASPDDRGTVVSPWVRVGSTMAIRNTATGTVLLPNEPGYDDMRKIASGWLPDHPEPDRNERRSIHARRSER